MRSFWNSFFHSAWIIQLNEQGNLPSDRPFNGVDDEYYFKGGTPSAGLVRNTLSYIAIICYNVRKRQPLNSILSQFNSTRTFVVRCLVQGRENFTFIAVLIFGIVSHGIKRTLCRHFSWNSLKSYPQRHLRISRSRLFCRPLSPKAQYTVLYVGLCMQDYVLISYIIMKSQLRVW
jgi:hypothetical protein